MHAYPHVWCKFRKHTLSVYENWCIIRALHRTDALHSVHPMPCSLWVCYPTIHGLYMYPCMHVYVIRIYSARSWRGVLVCVSLHLQASHMIECIVFSMHTIGTVRYLAFRSIVSEVSYISRSSSSPHAMNLSVLWSLIHWSRDPLCIVHTYLK